SYSSGDDYVVEFLGYHFSFNTFDFEQRVTAAAVKLGLVGGNDLDEEETADLVELTADGRIAEPRSGLGLYLGGHWERLSLVAGESLVYWLRKLVFRGAWLDHWVKDGRLDVAWEDETGEFAYVDPNGERALLEVAPIPSWHELQFRRWFRQASSRSAAPSPHRAGRRRRRDRVRRLVDRRPRLARALRP